MSSEFLTGVEYPHPFDELVVALCESASRQLCVLSPTLDHAVFDQAALMSAVGALVRRSRQTWVRFNPTHRFVKEIRAAHSRLGP